VTGITANCLVFRRELAVLLPQFTRKPGMPPISNRVENLKKKANRLLVVLLVRSQEA